MDKMEYVTVETISRLIIVLIFVLFTEERFFYEN